MRIYLLIWLSLLLLLTGFRDRKIYQAGQIRNRSQWFEPPPHGMVHIQRGSFTMGPSGEETDLHGKTVTVSVDAFWMDDTEITNTEYRQFVHWVRDSIARTFLGEVYPDYLTTEDSKGNLLPNPVINWRRPIPWNNPDIQSVLSDMYVPDYERIAFRKELDSRKLVYEYHWINFQEAARRINSYDFENQAYNGFTLAADGTEVPVTSRNAFLHSDRVPIYPDTLVWIRDFTYAYNEPLTKHYFSHRAFDDYPVVGISWHQARAFAHWRTQLEKQFRSRMNDIPAHDFRLPTEAEWEYASRGGKLQSMYPWGSYYVRDQEGCFIANFKPFRGNYIADSDDRATTNRVGSFPPNDFGLYDMAGNVAEWTSTAFFETGYSMMGDFNPQVEYHARAEDPPAMKRKVVRGGSYKDVSYFLQNGTRTYEYQDTTKSYVGFRLVRSTFRNEIQQR